MNVFLVALLFRHDLVGCGFTQKGTLRIRGRFFPFFEEKGRAFFFFEKATQLFLVPFFACPKKGTQRKDPAEKKASRACRKRTKNKRAR